MVSMADEFDGSRLRSIRQRRGFTLTQVADATGQSVSTLSRLESGLRKPRLDLLVPLARTYQVPLDELVGVPPASDPRVQPKPFTRHGITFLPLTRRPGGLQAFKEIIPPHWPPGEPDQRSHEGYEWLYILSGRLRLVFGDHDFVMQPGEAAEFDTHVPHWFGNPGPDPAELLCLYGPQGERMHVRARPVTRSP